jgi:hypothetical protein
MFAIVGRSARPHPRRPAAHLGGDDFRAAHQAGGLEPVEQLAQQRHDVLALAPGVALRRVAQVGVHAQHHDVQVAAGQRQADGLRGGGASGRPAAKGLGAACRAARAHAARPHARTAAKA